MPRPWGLGPVFAYEWLTSSRRWQMYASRSLVVALLLSALLFVWLSQVIDRPEITIHQLAEVGERFFYGVVGMQLTLVLLAAPAYTAGAVCMDRARGSLTHLLVTDLSSAEIVLGKLAARLIPVVGVVACGLPVLAFTIFFGGVDPEAVLGAFLIALGVALLSSTLALTFSIWAGKTHEVLLGVYLVQAVWLLALPLWRELTRWPSGFDGWELTNPYWLSFAPYLQPGATDLTEPLVFFAVCLALSFALIVLSVAEIRRVTLRHGHEAPRSAIPGPAGFWRKLTRDTRLSDAWLDNDPVLWLEWNRAHGSRWGRRIWAIYAVLAVIFSFIAMWQLVESHRPDEFPSLVNATLAAIGLLLLSVHAVTALADERVRGSLDVLLTTPLSTAAIVRAKWWGTYRLVFSLALLPTLVAAVAAFERGQWLGAVAVAGLMLAYGAAITSLGLALATWEPRLGRAVAYSVAAYALVSVGWVFAVFVLLRKDDFSVFLAEASPFVGIGVLTGTMGGDSHFLEALLWAFVWIAFYLFAARMLYRATLRTFDRCVGRMARVVYVSSLPARSE